MSDKLYYINGEWITYEQAHSLGYTAQRPEVYTLYTSDGSPIVVRKDVSDNKFYDAEKQTWVTDIDDIPVYKLVDEVTLYVGEESATMSGYSNSFYSDIITNVIIDDNMKDISDLYDEYGVTDHKCNDYYVDEGEVLVWYDPSTSLYFDNRDGKKEWSETPPTIQKTTLQDVFIMPNDTSAYLLPQWEEDLSQMPMRYRVSAFDEQDAQMDAQKPMLTGFPIAFGNDNLDAPVMTAYPDISELNKTFYVYPDKGVADYTGKHHEQGDTFIGDYKYVWVDSDQDVVFYKGQQRYVFGQSHDEKYFELYWCEDKYRTYQEVLNLGYSPTPSEGGLKASDTNIEFEIDDVYNVMENKSLGYYCNGNWYPTIADLNNAGYYLVEKIYKVVRPSNGTYCSIEPNITKNSVSFNTSNYKITLKNEDNTDFEYWDGNNWFIDPSDSAEFQYSEHWINYAYALNISEMPSSTTSSSNSYTNLYVPITSSGTPLNKFSNSDDGKLYLYMCSNYTSSNSIYSSYFQFVKMSYWKLI